MNLQKELVSQEIVIDEKLESDMIDGKVMDFSKELTPSSECVPRKRLADWIEDADRKDSSDENDSQVEDENKLEHLSASVSGSLDVHSIINTDQKDSSNENAPLVEDRIKQKRSSAPDVVNADPPIRRGLSASTASGKVLSYGYTPRSNRTQNYSKDAEQMSVDSQKLNQGQPLVWVPPPPPDPPNPHRK